MRIADSVSFLSALLIAGCGGAPVAAPVQSPVAEGVLTPAAASPAPSAEPHEPAQAEAPEPASQPEPKLADKAEADPNATRDITYVVVPEGLKMSVSGVKFTVSAAATQIAAGWGVKVDVLASAVDGKPHALSSPKAGPLAFAGTVQRKGRAEAEHFGDERVGDGELAVFGDDATKFSRTWPVKGTRVLGAGDALDLQVALWGLGAEKEARRPVKQFCHVRMQVEQGKPRARLEPPASVSGK